MTITLYHNPRCSKSRAALRLLEESGAEIDIIHYLQDPPAPEQIAALLRKLGLAPRDLIRKREEVYKTLGLASPDLSDEELIAAMAAHPILIERPIAVKGGKAVIGRPPEKILGIL